MREEAGGKGRTPLGGEGQDVREAAHTQQVGLDLSQGPVLSLHCRVPLLKVVGVVSSKGCSSTSQVGQGAS